MNLVVMASGRGSNFCALADAIHNHVIPNARIIALLCNKKTASVIQEANRRQIPVHLIESRKHIKGGAFNRFDYEKECIQLLQSLNPDFILLAGYMLILGNELVEKFPMKIVNIHPSLLPAFRGLKPQQQALEAKVPTTGCTVHFVTAALDDGPIIAQSPVTIEPDDTEESLSARLLPIEHRTYVEAVKKLCSMNYSIVGSRVFFANVSK